MPILSRQRLLLIVGGLAAAGLSCAEGSSSVEGAGGTPGSAGMGSGAGGVTGAAATGGGTGRAGTTGSAGVSGTAGATGSAGTTGTAGGPGAAGVTGTGGVTGAAGAMGRGGGAGTSSTGGRGGTSSGSGGGGGVSTGGTRATAGAGGSGAAGRAGTSGAAGSTGAAGTTGAAGSSSGDQLIGWASVSGLGLNTTTGGSGGPTTTVTTCSALRTAASQSGAAIINVSGSITCDNVVISSNKSLIGLAGAKIVATSGTTNHLLVIQNVSNIILQNLVVQGAGVSSGNKSGGDVVHVESSVHHLWVDHLDISDGDDGNFDITHDCNFITVSWTKFHYTSGSRAHRFSDLIAAALGDTGTYKITWHHNWWATNVDQRSPRAHEGSGGIHVFNNYYSEAGNSYCIGVGANAIFLSENNYFDGVNTPFYMTPDGETGGQILSKGDVFHNTTGNQTGTGKGFTPPYPYTLDPAANVPALVQAGAGPH